MKTIGYAIVGTGYFGAELGRIMKEQEGAKIVAVYDPENAETVAKELGCDVETDLDKLCSRDDVDAVLVASPNYLHKEPVLTAARHKKQADRALLCGLRRNGTRLQRKRCDLHGRPCHELLPRGTPYKAADRRGENRSCSLLPLCTKRLGRAAAVHQLEEDSRKIRWSPLSPYPRAGLHSVPDGTGNRGYHDWR